MLSICTMLRAVDAGAADWTGWSLHCSRSGSDVVSAAVQKQLMMLPTDMVCSCSAGWMPCIL